jgi:hypothetical protein
MRRWPAWRSRSGWVVGAFECRNVAVTWRNVLRLVAPTVPGPVATWSAGRFGGASLAATALRPPSMPTTAGMLHRFS